MLMGKLGSLKDRHSAEFEEEQKLIKEKKKIKVVSSPVKLGKKEKLYGKKIKSKK